MARKPGAQRRAEQSKNRPQFRPSAGTGPTPRTRQGRRVGPKDGETQEKEGNPFRFEGKSKTWKPVNNPKPEAKPAAKPAAKPEGGLARNWRSRANGSPATAPTTAPRSPAIGAPIHARPQAFGSNTKISDGTLSAAPANGSVYAPQAGQAPRPNAPVASSYQDGGKGLYKGSEEYVKATGGNYNPLMQKTFGYQTGGQPGAAQAPGTPPQSNDKVNTPMSPQYNGNDEPGALGQAENPMAALGQMLLQRKKLSISLSN